MAMLYFTLGLLLLAGVVALLAAWRKARLPGDTIDLDLPDEGDDRPTRYER